VKTINANNELPYYYNYQENYFLAETMDIITHIVKHVLCSSLYYAIIKIIAKYLIELNKGLIKGNNKMKKNIYDKLSNSNLLTELHNYILLKMPKMLVKRIIGIYEYDYEETVLDVNKLFEKIINILTSSNEFPFSVDSTLIINFKETIFDYYKEIFNSVIPVMYNLIEEYNVVILNESRYVKNAKIINEHISKSL
jgi:hypothetical protein